MTVQGFFPFPCRSSILRVTTIAADWPPEVFFFFRLGAWFDSRGGSASGPLHLFTNAWGPGAFERE